MAALRLLRAVVVALAVASLGAAQDYVSQALANSFSVDGDASVRAVRIMLNGDNSVLTVAWDDDPAAVADEFCGARQLEDAANREVVGHIAAALQSDGATRRALLDWADRVDDAIAPERPGAQNPRRTVGDAGGCWSYLVSIKRIKQHPAVCVCCLC